MIVYLKNGDRHIGTWSDHMIVGFVAERIEIDADDVKAIREYAMRVDAQTWNATMRQFEHRFANRRVGYKP